MVDSKTNTASDLSSDWATASAAEKLLKMPKRRVCRLGERGDVQRKEGAALNGKAQWLYYLPELRAFASDEGGAQRGSQDFAISRLLEVQTKHIEELYRLTRDPLSEQLQALREENKDLREHQKRMADEYINIVKLREELLDQKHTRELANEIAQESGKTKREALELLKKAAPFVFHGIMETVSRRQAFGALRDSLTDEQIEVFCQGMTDDQAEMFREVFRKRAVPMSGDDEPEPEPAQSEPAQAQQAPEGEQPP